MSEFAVSGDELKKLLKISAKGPISFAFCPGSSAETDLFGLHRKKSPDIMAKALRAEGDGSKVAFGTVEMEGKVVSLRCDRVLPSLAKKVKKFFKLNKVMKNVRILDADGNVLEEDIEDLPEDPEDASDGIADAATGPETDAVGEPVSETEIASVDAAPAEDDAAPAEAGGADLSQLAVRAKALHPQVMAVPAPTGDKLRVAFASAVASIKAQNGEAAGKTLATIEQVLARVDGPAGVEQPVGPAAETEGPGAATLKKLQDAAVQLAQRIKALPEGEARTGLAAQVRDLIGAIREGAVERAISGLRSLQAALKLAEGGEPRGEASATDPLEQWTAAKGMADVAVSSLLARLRGMSDPDLARIAESGLAAMTECNQAALGKGLQAFNAATGADRAKAAAGVQAESRAYRAFLDASPVIALCERNPFGVAVDLRGPLGRALDEIDRAVATVAA